MENTIFYIITGIIVFDFLLERLLDYLNTTRWSDELPPELEGIYDPEKYSQSQSYLKVKTRYNLVLSTFSFVLIISMILCKGFGFISNEVQEVTPHPVLQALLFFGVIGLASDLISTPFSAYFTFVIEEKFGFNKTTLRTFILDKIKSWLLMIIIGGLVLSLVVWIFEVTGSSFWIWVWLVLSAISIFMSMFYSTLIVPLFNKQKPLEAGSLRDKIEAFAQKVQFKLTDIYTIDGSKRSTKANAYFTGFGPKKRIVLYDTLIEKHTEEELVAVLAHEAGHFKKKHVLSGLVMSLVNSLLVLYVLSLFLSEGSDISNAIVNALGGNAFSFHLGLLGFGLLYGPLSLLTGLLMNAWSRKNEYEADRFAADHYSAQALSSALIKLSTDSLSNLRPHPAYVVFYYSHPGLPDRLKGLRKSYS
ncbi:MAG TPA: M48 family metallopeptidase [Saprospiraceae bacterium]|nr:M48 family metallopeptidase [Saprospiraceae bacterium]